MAITITPKFHAGQPVFFIIGGKVRTALLTGRMTASIDEVNNVQTIEYETNLPDPIYESVLVTVDEDSIYTTMSEADEALTTMENE